jgi:hypothetical protein
MERGTIHRRRRRATATLVLPGGVFEIERVASGEATADLLARQYRLIGMHQQMNAEIKGGNTMEIFIPLGVLVAWIILQVWLLPRFGVKA